MGAGEELDQGGLAGPVLADDGVNLPLPEGKVDALEGVGSGEPFVELAKLENRRVAQVIGRQGRTDVPLGPRLRCDPAHPTASA
jgi:hypothetical protein